jgi:Xaa-Pro aminopeptidase
VETLEAFLLRTLKPHEKVAVDPTQLSWKRFDALSRQLDQQRLVPLAENWVDACWTHRPSFPASPALLWAEPFAGASVHQKLQRMEQWIVEQDADWMVVNELDAIAWLFNLRGTDIPFNPFKLAFALLGPKEHHLYLNLETSLPSEALPRTTQHPYLSFFADYPKKIRAQRVVLDPGTAPASLVQTCAKVATPVLQTSPLPLWKATKNATECAGMEEAHRLDGIAMVKTLIWLEQVMAQGQLIHEAEVADQVLRTRKSHPSFQGPSFATIAGTGPNGAIVHYAPPRHGSRPLKADELLLLDSGGHYLEGTTDITRTVCLGTCTPWQKTCFTRVLQGHLALSTAIFPEGTDGPQLDSLARRPLWDGLLNYGHGTGHGVGCFLSVHEGPQSISPHRGHGVALLPGMVCSVEPGYYETGAFGIRIENLVTVERLPEPGPSGSFLRFKPLTRCPIDLNLIDFDLLTGQERQALNDYHQWVAQELSPGLEPEERQWLEQATRPI